MRGHAASLDLLDWPLMTPSWSQLWDRDKFGGGELVQQSAARRGRSGVGSSTLATKSHSSPGYSTGEASSYNMCRLLGLQSERNLFDTYHTASDISAIAQGVSVEQLIQLQRFRGIIDFQDNHTTLRGCVSHHSCHNDKPILLTSTMYTSP